jgi:uncharacterized membrane protein YfcA
MCIFLGFFTGMYSSYIGTVGGSAIMMYLLLQLKILPSVSVISGTMLLISCIPLGIFGLYDYYKHKDINYYYGAFIAVGLITGLVIGSKSNFIVDDLIGEKYNDKIKFGVTSIIFFVLSILYGYKAFGS